MWLAGVGVQSPMDTWMQSPKKVTLPARLKTKSTSLLALVPSAAERLASSLEDTEQEHVVKRQKTNNHIILTDSEDDST